MKKYLKFFFEFLLVLVLKIAFWFRYQIKIEGLEKLNENTLNKPGGILFLPNHCTIFIDAAAISSSLWPKYRTRAMIIEYMYYMPGIHWIMKTLNALPVPSFSTSSNSLKKRKTEKVMQEIIQGLKNKENFLIFPAGHVKLTNKEILDAASATHRLAQEAPEANIVLVRIKGLWGSSFSRALTGKNPPMWKTILAGMKHVLKNLLFFTPRRQLIIELEPAPSDFPWEKGKLEFNKYLENWYNRPDGLSHQQGAYPGESLVLVSYSMWKNELPQIAQEKKEEERIVAVESISEPVRTKVIKKIAELTNADPHTITPNMMLSTDLGMDSLDIAELVAFLQDQFDITGVPPDYLTSVGSLMAIADKQVVVQERADEEYSDLSQWNPSLPHERVQIAEGSTIPAVFLNNAQLFPDSPACGDMRSGILTYSQLKLRVLTLALYIKDKPGDYIGIMLPASVVATIAILACQLAGKIPLMINWTVGARHLQSVAELSKVQLVLSAWSFIERLQNVELTGIEDQLIMLEDVRREVGLSLKAKALVISQFSNSQILRTFGIENLSPDHPAVLLFTSGTENLPKGVPLSHNNILINQRDALSSIALYRDDVIFGILPPFHSFGFTITSLIGILSGIRVAYSPDPTDGPRLANGFHRWGGTIMCGAPTFIKTLIKAAKPEQLKTMRLCIVGAEKLPSELVNMLKKLNKEDCLLEGYGITECAPVLTFTPLGKPRIGVGLPLPRVQLRIIDVNTHSVMPKGQQGLILARGPNVFSGYINPGLSSPFINLEGTSWYVTGDLGYLEEQGNLIIAGRLKRFIKVGGEMVSLSSLEDALVNTAVELGGAELAHETPLIAVSAKEYPGERPKIVLYTTLPINLDDANQSLKAAGFSNLIKFTEVKRLPEIPVMGTGKINYRKLDELLE